jgi:hypothetical protein
VSEQIKSFLRFAGANVHARFVKFHISVASHVQQAGAREEKVAFLTSSEVRLGLRDGASCFGFISLIDHRCLVTQFLLLGHLRICSLSLKFAFVLHFESFKRLIQIVK